MTSRPALGRFVSFCGLAMAVAGPVLAQSLPARQSMERLAVLNAAVTGESLRPGDPAALRALQERSGLLYDLMKTAPDRALALALSSDDAARIASAFPAQVGLVETHDDLEGPAQAKIADDFEHGRSEKIWRLTSAGRNFELYFAGDAPALPCERVLKIAGLRLGDRVVASSAAFADPQALSSCTTLGVQQSLVVMVAYPHTGLPASVTASSLQTAFFGGGRSLSTFWNESSYGMTSAAGTVIGPYVLDADYTCDQYSQIKAAAIRAVDSSVDLRNYSRIFLVLPNTGSCGWAGLGDVGCSGNYSPLHGNFTASTTWLLSGYFNNNDATVGYATHEGGHNLGLEHSGSLDFGSIPLGTFAAAGAAVEYGDPFSVMGASNYLGQYTAPQKIGLGWLQNGTNKLDIQSNGTFTLLPYEATTSGLQTIRVRRSLTSNRWLWLEYRRPLGMFEAFAPGTNAFSGALIHHEDNNDPSHAKLLDFNPVSAPNNFNTAALLPGRTWNDPEPTSVLSLTMNSASPAGLTVTVSYGGAVFVNPSSLSFNWQQGNAAPAAQSVSLSVNSASYSYTSSVAASGGSWLAFNPTSGAIPGSASVSVNPSGLFPGAYNGSITIDIPGAPNTPISIPVTLTVVPNPAAPQALSVSPSSGTGSGQTFAFVFSDPGGFANLGSAEMNINTSVTAFANGCYLHFDAAQKTIALQNDAANSWGAALALGGPGALENSQCGVSASASSANGSGNNFSVNLALYFKLPFVGARVVGLQTQNSAWSTGWQQRGTWTVDNKPAAVAVTPAAGSGPLAAFTYLFTDPNGYSDLNYVQTIINTSTAISGGCSFYYFLSSNNLGLYGDDGSGSITSIIPGSFGTAQNSSCVLRGAGSSVVKSGNTLALTVNTVFKPAFAGFKNIYLTESGNFNYVPPQQRGTWQVTQSQIPLSVTPDSGTGASQTFSFVFSDPSTGSNIPWVEMRVSPADSSSNACYVHYDMSSNAFTLRNDGNTAWSAALPLNSGGTVQNGACVVNAPGSSVSSVGGNLTVNLAVSFRPPFIGSQVVYGATPATALVPLGLWTVNSAPEVISVSPGTGSGSAQVFTFTVVNPSGFASNSLYINFNTASNITANGCNLYFYGGSTGLVYLYNDAGVSFSSILLGSTAILQNSQCVVNGSGSSVSVSGTIMTFTLALNFKSAFTGPRNIYMQDGGSSFTPWQLRGNWTVTVPLPAVNIDVPAAGAAVSGTISVAGWAIDNASAVGTAISGVQVKVDGNLMGTATYGGARPDVCVAYPGRVGCPNVGYLYALNTAALSPGAHTISVLATSSGVSPNTGLASVMVNVAAVPAVYIDSPAAGASLTGTATISGWALDNAFNVGTAISAVQVRVDGTLVGTASYGSNRSDVCVAYPGRPGCPNVGFSYALNTSTLASGTHTVTVSAINSATTPLTGSASVAITVPVTPPSVYIDYPTAGAAVSGTVNIGGWALDNIKTVGSAIANVQVKVDGMIAGNATYGGARADVCAAFPGRPGCPNVAFLYALNTNALTAGSHVITVSATNNASPPLTGSTAVTVTVPAIPPSIYFDYPLSGAIVNGTIGVAGWALDNTKAIGTAIASVQMKVDGVLVGNATYGSARADVCAAYPGRPGCPNVGFVYTLNAAGLTPGVHTLTAVATNSSVSPSSGSVSVSFVVPSPPSVYIDSPAANATVTGTFQITGWALDNALSVGTAIAAVQVRVDGTLAGNATYGGPRADVCGTYPGRPGCPNVGFSYLLNTTGLSAGNHTLTVSATDTDPTPATGSTSIVFKVAALPLIYLDSPVGGAAVSGKVGITGWALDNSGAGATPIAALQIKVDGVYVANANYGVARADVCGAFPGRPGCPNVGFYYLLDTAALTAGTHTITASATNSNSLPATGTAAVSVTVVHAPDVYIDSPVAGASVSGTINVSGWALDNRTSPGTAITSVQIKVDGTLAGNATYGTARADVCGAYPARPGCPNVGFTYSLNTTLLNAGPHTISVTATDSDATPHVGTASVNVVR